MDKASKAWLKGVPDYNKKHYADQLEKAEAMEIVDTVLPLQLFLTRFKLASGNDLIGKHPFIVDAYKKRCVRHMGLAGLKKVKKVKEKRFVHFLRLIPPRCREYDFGDNLQNGFKYIRDNLVTTGWLWDDSPSWIEPEYEDRKPLEHESWGVLITVKEIK